VRDELTASDAPPAVRAWATTAPPWLDIKRVAAHDEDAIGARNLDLGERDALALAQVLRADLILIDDRAAVAVARQLGFSVTGTLGVLALAARRGLIDLGDAFERLKTTNFRYPPEVMDQLLQSLRKDQRGAS